MNRYLLLFLMVAACCLTGCEDNEEEIKKPDIVIPGGEDNEEYVTDDTAYGNFFGFNVMNDVYLWKGEIEEGLQTWQLDDDPIEKTDEVRYKEGEKDIDKWSMMTTDYTALTSGTDGKGTTYGYGFKLYQYDDATVTAVVTHTYADSPARQAGLQRGDLIVTVNGKTLPLENDAFVDIVYDELLNSSTVQIGYLRNQEMKEATLTAVSMYEDPVLVNTVYDIDGKKVGYLAYTSFTLESNARLIEVCQEFKQAGVTELILDLRYNGGGYVITENLLASMLAPENAVKNKELYQTEVWNNEYMEYYQKNGVDLNTYFQTEYNYTDFNGVEHSLSTADANIGLNKIYALVTSSSASASESILVGLLPFGMPNIEIIGEQTHGKYCTGQMISAKEWMEDTGALYDQLQTTYPEAYESWKPWSRFEKYMKTDWGIYVMINRYADRNGNNPCMPDGLTPDLEVKDEPFRSEQLGDENETMLKAALTRAGKIYPAEGRSIDAPVLHDALRKQPHDKYFGMRIDNRHKIKPLPRLK